jgi:hypothetical protein
MWLEFQVGFSGPADVDGRAEAEVRARLENWS